MKKSTIYSIFTACAVGLLAATGAEISSYFTSVEDNQKKAVSIFLEGDFLERGCKAPFQKIGHYFAQDALGIYKDSRALIVTIRTSPKGDGTYDIDGHAAEWSITKEEAAEVLVRKAPDYKARGISIPGCAKS